MELFREKRECTGCAACFFIYAMKAISMVLNEEGFLYPQIDNKACVKCKACLGMCPIITKKPKNNQYKNFVGRARNGKMLKRCSSGVSVLSVPVMKNDGAVFGAVFDNEFALKQRFVSSIFVMDAKYIQSEISDSFVE